MRVVGIASFVAVLLSALILISCGGSGVSAAPTQGNMSFTVHWPQRNTRLIPIAANSIRIDASTAAGIAKTVVIPRVPGQNTASTTISLPTTKNHLTITARPDTAGQGIPQASAATDITILAGQTNQVQVTLQSTVTHVLISPSPLGAPVGQSVTATATAYDAANNIVLTDGSTWQWKLSTTSVVSITPNGESCLVSRSGDGSPTLTATETESGQSQNTTFGTSSAGGLANAPWPKIHANTLNTGQASASGAIGALNWVFHSPGLTGSPVVGGDGTVYAGTDGDGLYAMNSNGTVKWVVQTSNGVIEPLSPAIASDGTIYVASPSGMYAINPDGSSKWYSQTYNSQYAAPTIGGDGTIYIGNTSLYAVNPDGSQKWIFNYSSGLFDSTPAVLPDGTVYVQTSDGTLHALDKNGSQKWSLQLANLGGVDAGPAVGADGTIYVADSPLYAVNPDGTIKWTAPTVSAFRCPAIGSDGTIYAQGNYLYAINPDGTTKWAIQPDYPSNGSPVVGTDGTVYFATNSGYYFLNGSLYALNPDGSTKWSYSIRPVTSNLAMSAGGVLYLSVVEQQLLVGGGYSHDYYLLAVK